MNAAATDIKKHFTLQRIFIPIFIGLSAAGYLVYVDFDISAFKQINWSAYSILWLIVALLMMGVRDLAYMYRIRVLTDYQINWRRSFDVIMLWEFASAITPSVVGGSGVALYIIHKEGISTGRSTAIVMVTAILDELFYVIMVPVLIIMVGSESLFPIKMEKEIFGIELHTQGIFWGGYTFICLLVSIFGVAIFYRPRGFKYVLLQIFRIPFLRKWRHGVAKTGDDIMITSRVLRGKPLSFWIKAFGATFFSWTARYWVVNFLILAFIVVDDHFLIYARQLVMWILLLISPTPGGSGIAEAAFTQFLGDLIPLGLGASLALLWRLISYYLYLFIGAVVLPKWINRVYRKPKGTSQN